MSTQLDCLAMDVPAYSCGTAPGAARSSDTSKEAAAHVATDLGERQRVVLETLRAIGPATGEEVATRLRKPTYTVLPRITELSLRNLVVDSGERRVNSTGRRATVWAVAA